MQNYVTNHCPACRLTLRRTSGNTAVCPQCFRTFQIQNEAFQNPTLAVQQSSDPKLTAKIVCLAAAVIVTLVTGVFPLTIFLSIRLMKYCTQKDTQTAAQKQPAQRSGGTPLKTRSDHLHALRSLPLYDMPLGTYGERAIHQIERLEQKQKALLTMLGSDHPFIRSGNEAEEYILNNCRQILYRLEFCDQTEPEFRSRHANFLQQRLDENEKLLHDFENLVIEVTQMDLDLPEAVPCLDVLADTLHSIRTQDDTLTEFDCADNAYLQRRSFG